MNSIKCSRCGTDYDTSISCCPSCGMFTAPEHEQNGDQREKQLRELLKKARSNAQTGDLATALRFAREALSQRQDCSTTHALLGQLYEQQGDPAAARYHFQAALNVTSPEPEEPPVVVPPPADRQPRLAGFMMLILIGCIVFSGLAALVAFRPAKFNSLIGSSVESPPKPHSSFTEKPRWTLNVPQSMRAPQQHPAIGSEKPLNENVKTASSTENTVLGPSAHHRGILGIPSLESADQAFFRGEYDRAVTLYEAVIPTLELPNPRIYRDSAWCYQQLGNSQKAADYLGKAVQGYQEQLDNDPANSAAQQELERCQAALQTLIATNDEDSSTTP